MTNVQLEQLLKHESFLRGFARSLLRDSARADDVVQEAWLVALRSSKRPDEVQRGWLAGIVRNLVRRGHRDDARRARRERIAARGGSERPADEVVADRLLGRRIAKLVLALPEHYREPLLLRYFDGLEPQAIGVRLGMSSSTVRTRLQRGLQKVRTQLAAARNGGTRALGLALVPLALAGPRVAWRVPRGIAAAVLVGSTAALWWGVVPAFQRTAAVRTGFTARAEVDRAPAAPVAVAEASVSATNDDERAAGSVLWMVRARVPRGVFTPTVDVVVAAEGSAHRVVRRIEAGVRTAIPLDALLEAGRPARLILEAHHPECVPRTHEVDVPATHDVQPFDVTLARTPLVPPASLRIEDPVVRASLVPGAGAATSSTAASIELLAAGLREPSRRLVGIVLAPDDSPVALRVCRSDGRGVCLSGSVPGGRFFAVSVAALLDGPLPAALRVEASHAAAVTASVDVPVLVDTVNGTPVMAPFELTLAAGRRIEGRVVADDPVEGATVAMFAMAGEEPEATALATTVTDAVGRYAVTVEAVGRVLVVAAAAGHAPAGHEVTIDEPRADDEPVFVPDHELAAGVAIRGRVTDEQGRGVAATLRAEALTVARVTLVLTPGAVAIAYRGGDLAWQQATARADADGVYRVGGLSETEHRVTLAIEPDPVSRATAAPGTEDFVVPSARVDVFVRDEAGLPLAGARVALGAVVGYTGSAGSVPFSVPPGAERVLRITRDGYADATRTVTAPGRGAVHAVVVTLEPSSPLATLVVTLRGATAGPVPAVFGFLLLSPLPGRPATLLAPMEDGRFVLRDLAPGPYALLAYPGGATPPPTNFYLPASASASLIAGTTTEIALDLAVGGRIEVAVPDGAAVWLGSAPARRSRLSSATGHPFVEPLEGVRSRGLWRSRLLEPGRHEVTIVPWDRRRAAAQFAVDVVAGQINGR